MTRLVPTPVFALSGLVALAGPVLANTPITAEVFEDHVTGKTISYRQFDNLFGVEEYLPDRKVRWSTAPDECQYGTWYPSGENICFVYEYNPEPQCWTFWLQNGALVALSVNSLPGEELHEVEASDTPLPCPGPDVGV
jgi:hypothetical protein